MEIADRIAVVTGAGSGIGAALARQFAVAGARHVVVTDLDGDSARQVADEIDRSGPAASAVELDVTDESAIAGLVETVERDVGPVDVFASNAGYVTVAGLEDGNDSIGHMWDVHVMAHIYAARAVIPSMAARGEGYLLNTASAAGLLSQIGSMSYTITKHAAVALAEWLAITHHHHGVRVSVLCPQAVRTNIIANSPDRRPGDEVDIEDFGVAAADGILDPDEVARACLDAMAAERFLVLPHPQVADYVAMKAADIDGWLGGMRRFQDRLYTDESLPGDRILRD